MHKKSQITIMVILGIVILIGFTLLTFVTKIGEEEKVETRVIKLASEKVQAAAVEKHVNFCLEKALEDALILIAGQGGFIHKHQPGSVLTWNTTATDPYGAPIVDYTADDRLFEVGYRIEKDPNDVTPFYPCKTATNSPTYCGFMNNRILFPSVYNYDYGKTRSVFLDYGPFSIENQLKNHIENITITCVDFSRFRAFDITAGQINASVKISDEDVTTVLSFPLIIQVPNYYPVIKKYKFTSNKKVRLRKFHDAVNEIIKHDNKYLDFNLKENTLRGKTIDNKSMRIRELAVLVEKIENWRAFDDLFRIIDTSSKVGGKPYTYQFMRANRPPVLNLMRGNVAVPKRYDYVVIKGTEIIFEPKASDPDEDTLVYSYSGEENAALLMDSFWWKHPSTCQNRCANITFYEKGEHNITVYVTDGQYTDSQLVRIKVEDSAAAYTSTTEVLPDVPTNYASIEDPYVLKSESVTQQGTSYTYDWLDGTTTIHSTKNKCTILPTKENCSANPEVNINDMTGFLKPPYGDRTIKLELKQDGGVVSESTSEIQVDKCIPYVSALDIPPYPYHNITGNKAPSAGNEGFAQFYGDHTCCDGRLNYPSGWDYEDTNTECFRYELTSTCYPTHAWQKDVSTILGVMPVRGTGDDTPQKLEPISDTSILVSPCPGGDCTNDLYTLNLTQKCSGTRGNACSGEYDFKWEHKQACADKPTGQAETCSGPPLNSTQCPFSP
ncbi:hypothetical protein ACFLYT_01135, partial [Nanoarchaeota archaeon]